MGKKKNKIKDDNTELASKLFARGLNLRDRKLLEKTNRSPRCLGYATCNNSVVGKLIPEHINRRLSDESISIEQQFFTLKGITFDKKDRNLARRLEFTRCLLDCLYRHHGVVYEGILFGSSVNGLGFIDSDIDLRLRPLKPYKDSFEPDNYDDSMIERVLRNIAFQTTRCSQAKGEYVPCPRCPIARLTFVNGNRWNPSSLEEGWKYDIQISQSSLICLNSYYVRFLCRLEPKFHILALSLRYWLKVHDLKTRVRLSSYALINMLIFFCQNVSPPLLPTVNSMREKYLSVNDSNLPSGTRATLLGLTRQEWQCLVDLDEGSYHRSDNQEPLCLLLLKFFEFYIKFPYSQNIISTNTGLPISFEEFITSAQYHKQFPTKEFMNIQDPFDLKHNLTAGIAGDHFENMIMALSKSYEILASEIELNLLRPQDTETLASWGLARLFEKFHDKNNSPKKAGFPKKVDSPEKRG